MLQYACRPPEDADTDFVAIVILLPSFTFLLLIIMIGGLGSLQQFSEDSEGYDSDGIAEQYAFGRVCEPKQFHMVNQYCHPARRPIQNFVVTPPDRREAPPAPPFSPSPLRLRQQLLHSVAAGPAAVDTRAGKASGRAQ